MNWKFWKKTNKLKQKTLGGYTTTFFITGQPVWNDLIEYSHYLKAYETNPILAAAIDIRARFRANMRLWIEDLKTGEEITKEHKRYKEFESFIKLLKQPNPLQSTWEWQRFSSVNYDVFGDSYDYISVPSGYEEKFTYEDISVINNVYPYIIAPVLTGKWLDAGTKQEIISKYVITLNGKERDINTNQIYHTNNININLNTINSFTKGQSKIKTLSKPIANIDAALESRNVLITRRGALGAWTSESKDPVGGSMPLQPEEKKEAQEDLKEYGLLSDQYQHIISRHPLRFQRTALPVRELMLFEEIASDGIYIANQYGVPEILLKNYFEGTTYENQEASVRRMYEDTTIPEANDWVNGFNSFLKLDTNDARLRGTFDHLSIFQKNIKDQATAKSLDSKRLRDMFYSGAIVYNAWLTGVGFPVDSEIGNKRIWDLKPEQIAAIMSKPI